MRRQTSAALIGLVGLMCSAGLAASQESQDKMENYMANAAPVMHYSCASLVDEAGDNKNRILEVVRLLVAVSLHNRHIDVTTYKLNDAQKKEIKAKFVEMLKDKCADDDNALLAGIVDTSVHQLLSNK
jgi:hypothetical protein